MAQVLFSSKKVSTILRYILIVLNIFLPILSLLAIYYSNQFGSTIIFNDLTISLYELGKTAGTFSALVFCVTLFPGILRRFSATGVLRNIQITLTPIRPHLGVLMFILAFIHYIFVKILPTLKFNLQLSFTLAEITGFLAFVLCIPLALTSSMWLKRKMKQHWQKLHNLTYIILWLIFIHVALSSQPIIAFIILLTGALEIGSLLYAFKKA